MPPFLICIHDATPAYARETRLILRDLAPLVGRRLAFGVVPDWFGRWPLAVYRDYTGLLRESSEERLLHGYFHQRRRGSGPATWLSERSDEMAGLSQDEARQIVERGQQVFTEAFGERARGFLPPAWQRGRVQVETAGIEHVLGFFSIDAGARGTIPLATWTWDCGRWGWLGHVGHRLGFLSHALGRGVPTLAIHPRDIERGFWPATVRLTQRLLRNGYEPVTVARLVERHNVEAAL